MMVSVVCWKWAAKKECRHREKKLGFSADHVRILEASLRRHSTVPFRFFCVTDDREGTHNGAETINISRHFPDIKGFEYGCHRRLRAFDLSTSLALFGGRFISIDIDVVITGNVDHILSFDDDFRVWQDDYRRRTPYCGSLWGMRAGARQHVWDTFRDRPHVCTERAKDLKFTGTDQAHMSAVLSGKEKVWGTEDGVYNFNTRVRKQVRSVYRKVDGTESVTVTDGTLPDNACMVFFNGKYDPSQRWLQRDYPWIRKHWCV